HANGNAAISWRAPPCWSLLLDSVGWSGDTDDRGNLSRATRLGLLQCIERRRRLEGLLGQEGDRKLEKLAGAACLGCTRPASPGGGRGRIRGQRRNRGRDCWAAGHRGGPPGAGPPS